MVKPRKILHLDLDAFFCAVEELRNPDLSGKVFAVGGAPNGRGVITSASYAARLSGVRSAMPTSQALKLCPQLILVNSHFSAYREASQRVMAIIGDLTPLVEQISIDEAFMDLSDLPEPGMVLARNLQSRIRGELNLPCSIGIATNKLVAKTATDIGKAAQKKGTYPNALLEVPPGEEEAFFSALPIQSLWGIGPKTTEFLNKFGVVTLGELAQIPEEQLVHYFGKGGFDLARHARGIDERPVETLRQIKSISQETTFDQDVRDRSVIERTLRNLSENVGYRLRQDNLSGVTVRIKLRWSDFSTLTRQISLGNPTDQDNLIYTNALSLFNHAWTPGRPVRLIGVGVSGLNPSAHQLSLWDVPEEKEHRLLAVLDDLRERYGGQVVKRASEIKSSGDENGIER